MHPGNAVRLFLLGSPAGGHPRTPVQGSPCTRPNLLSPPYLKEEIFIFFLSPERKPKQKKECENVLSSEAGTQILQITQRTRYAQTAFRISLFRLRSAIRNSISIQRICIPLKTSSCGMFSNVFASGVWGLAPIKQ